MRNTPTGANRSVASINIELPMSPSIEIIGSLHRDRTAIKRMKATITHFVAQFNDATDQLLELLIETNYISTMVNIRVIH